MPDQPQMPSGPPNWVPPGPPTGPPAFPPPAGWSPQPPPVPPVRRSSPPQTPARRKHPARGARIAATAATAGLFTGLVAGLAIGAHNGGATNTTGSADPAASSEPNRPDPTTTLPDSFSGDSGVESPGLSGGTTYGGGSLGSGTNGDSLGGGTVYGGRGLDDSFGSDDGVQVPSRPGSRQPSWGEPDSGAASPWGGSTRSAGPSTSSRGS
ncbi:MAG: hypothetical protein ACOYML_06485 [Microthrixaceae bacterium]